jgi:hypothetical protein
LNGVFNSADNVDSALSKWSVIVDGVKNKNEGVNSVIISGCVVRVAAATVMCRVLLLLLVLCGTDDIGVTCRRNDSILVNTTQGVIVAGENNELSYGGADNVIDAGNNNYIAGGMDNVIVSGGNHYIYNSNSSVIEGQVCASAGL